MGNVLSLPSIQALQPRLIAALYARASHDPRKRGTSTRDQFEVGEMVCEELGAEIYGYYEDRGLSATRKAKKVRKDFQRLTADAEAGCFNVIVYADKSRIARDLEVSIPLRSLCERTGVKIYYDGRLYDMRVPKDRQDFTNDAVAAEAEGEDIIKRADRTARLNARRGRPHGVVAFGYRRRYDPDDGTLIGQEPHPELAPVVITMFDMIDQGKSQRSVLAYARQFRPTMTFPGLKVILSNKTYIGVRTNRGQEYEAQWDRLVSDEVFYRVQARIRDTYSPRAEVQQKLLSGEAWCASCRPTNPAPAASKMRAFPGRTIPPRVDGKGKAWGARVFPATYGCGGRGDVSIVQHRADAWVEEAVLAWLSSPAAREAFRHDARDADIAVTRALADRLTRELEEAQTLAKTIDPMTGLTMLSVASLAAVEQGLLPALKAARAKLQQLMELGDPLLDRLVNSGGRIESVWNDELDMDQRRSVLRSCVRIEILKATTRGRCQPSVSTRIRLIFRGEAGFDEWPGPAATAS